MTKQFIEQFAVPGTSPYTYAVSNPTGAALVSVQGASGAPISGCTITSGVLTVPSGEAGATLWVVYTATVAAGAPSKGMIGRGTVFSMSAAGAGIYTSVAQLKTGQFAGQKINFDDISNLDSPLVANNTVLKEVLPATADGGTLALAGIFLPLDAGQLALQAAYGGTLQDFKIQLPKGPGQTTTGNLYAFSGYVSEGVYPDIQFDKTLSFKSTVTLTTPITLTPGS